MAKDKYPLTTSGGGKRLPSDSEPYWNTGDDMSGHYSAPMRSGIAGKVPGNKAGGGMEHGYEGKDSTMQKPAGRGGGKSQQDAPA